MTTVLVLLFLACLAGLAWPYAGFKRSHFGLGAVASFLLVGVTAPASEKKDGALAKQSALSDLSPAEKAALETKNANEIADLKRRAAKLPADDLEANQRLYKRLVDLAPGNYAYVKKLDDYENKILARGRYAEHPEEALKLGTVDWSTGGFGSVMIINRLTIKNEASFPIKDFTLSCVHFAPSGTEIDSNKRTIYEIVPANGSKTIRHFNMGFIASQAESTSCRITRAVPA